MVDKLEACPFCGGEASLTIPSEHVQADCADIYVSCDECEAEGQHFVVEMQDRTPDLWPYEQRDAIAAWNTRATPANGEQVERVARAITAFDAADWCDCYPQARVLRDLLAATPTQDARERGKALEEALEAIESAPKDGTMVRLLIDYTDGGGPLEDALVAWTIGFNDLDGTGVDEWKFAGWCWTHDHFSQGSGRPVGWLPWSNPSTGGDAK